MKRLSAIFLALILTPVTVLGTPGGYRCIDGILRPTCCCPEDELENANSAPELPSLLAPPCCDYEPGKIATAEPREAKNQSSEVLVFTHVLSMSPIEEHAAQHSSTLRKPRRHPPPRERTFLQLHSFLL